MADARAAVDALRAACDEPGRGLAVVEVGGGVRLVTRPEHAPVLLSLQKLRLKSRLSRAAVETLTIVAYRQPISAPRSSSFAGWNGERAHPPPRERLVRVVGRKASPGRPVLYGTTREFLEHRAPGPRGSPRLRTPGGGSRRGHSGSGAAETGPEPAGEEREDPSPDLRAMPAVRLHKLLADAGVARVAPPSG